MTQQVRSPLEQVDQEKPLPVPEPETHFSRAGVVSVLILIAMVFLLFTGLSFNYFPLLVHSSVQVTVTPTGIDVTATPTPGGPVQIPPTTAANADPAYAHHYVLYEQKSNIYTTSVVGGTPRLLNTPGYVYSRAVPPLVTPAGQLLYSGDGLWLTDIFQGTPHQIAAIAPDQVVTSMVLSTDGTMIAWSTEPKNGNGVTSIYAGPLEASQLVYRNSAANCPCFRVFSFLDEIKSQDSMTLLLTDDRSDHSAVQYGLWALTIAHVIGSTPTATITSMPAITPTSPAIVGTPGATATTTAVGPIPTQSLLDEDSLQMPLALAPGSNTLLYSTYGGVVPEPTDESVPDDVAALNYANSLLLTTISSNPLTLQTGQVLLPEQRGQSNIAEYHWVMSPLFSPDGHTLVYVVFSSDSAVPFARHSSLYTVQITGSGTHMQAHAPELLATASSRFVEVGTWLDNHTFTFYADGVIYTLDIMSGNITTVAQANGYAHIVATVEQKQPAYP